MRAVVLLLILLSVVVVLAVAFNLAMSHTSSQRASRGLFIACVAAIVVSGVSTIALAYV